MERSPTIKKSLFTSDTKLQSSLSVENLNITQRNKRPRQNEDINSNEFCKFKEDIKSMITTMMLAQQKRLDSLEDHIKIVMDQNQEIRQSNQDIEKSMNFMCEQLQELDASIKNLDHDYKDLKLEISTLNERIGHLEKNSIKNYIEIRNVPKIQNETKKQLYNMVLMLTKNLNMEIANNDIKDVSRGISKKESHQSAILVEFQTSLTKSEMLLNTKKFILDKNKTRLTASHCGLNGNNTPIYISELLTKNMKQIFYETKSFAKNSNYAHCWISNGRVLLREKEGGPYITIKTMEQLTDLKNSNKK